MDPKAKHFLFIGLRQGVIGQSDEGAVGKIIPISPGIEGELHRLSAVEKNTDLQQGLDIIVVHDGINPLILSSSHHEQDSGYIGIISYWTRLSGAITPKKC